jgi:hypothetical protein
MHAFQVQQQQAQADQVALAGEIYGQAKMALVKKKQELEQRQRENPDNPTNILTHYTEFAQQLYKDVSSDPRLEGNPLAQKYIATHVGTGIATEIEQYTKEQGDAWKLWNRANTDQTIRGPLRDAAIANPADLAHIAAALTAGKMLGTYSPAEADRIFDEQQDDIYEQRAINFARAHAPEWDAARRAGKMHPEYTEGKYLKSPALARVDAAARDELRYRQEEAVQQREATARQLKELQSAHSAETAAKYFGHIADPKKPPLTVRDIENLMTVDDAHPVPRLAAEDARAYYGLLKADAQHAEAQKGEDNYLDVYKLVTLPWSDPNKITRPEEVLRFATVERDGVVTRKLTVEQIRQLGKDIELGHTPGGMAILKQREIFLEGQKGLIDHSNLLMTHGAGKDAFAEFTRQLIAREQQYRDRNEDPSPLYNSASPEYFGQHTHLFQKSMEQTQEEMYKGLMRPPASMRIPDEPSTKSLPPYKPGMTWQQWKDKAKVK